MAGASKPLLARGEDRHRLGCNKLLIRVTLEKISQGEISSQCLNIVSKQ